MKNILYMVIVLVLVAAGAWWFMGARDGDDAMMGDDSMMATTTDMAMQYVDTAYECTDGAGLVLTTGPSNELLGVTFTRADGEYLQEMLPIMETEDGTVYEGYGARVSWAEDNVMVAYADAEYTCTEKAADAAMEREAQ